MDVCSIALRIASICWGVFFVVWVVAAFSTKRSIYRENRGQRLRYWLLLIAGCYLLFHRQHFSFDIHLVPCTDPIATLCTIACVLGLAFCIWARITLGRNWSGAVTLKADHELIERGPYRWVRHPIYTGLLMMFLATAILLGRASGLIGAVLVFISFWIKLCDEEKVMLKAFPDSYRAYRQRTKRIIPFIL